MSDDLIYRANLQRGSLLRENGRYQEAWAFIGKAIEAEPNRPDGYVEAAICLKCWDYGNQALKTIDRAISLDPANAQIVAIKAWIVVSQENFHVLPSVAQKNLHTALNFVSRALEIDPHCLLAFRVRADAYTYLGQWKDAEVAALQILALAPDDIPALNLLAQALRLQRKNKESADVVRSILESLPNDALGQANAGYGALAVGDHQRANTHFLEALRINPQSNHARRGLLDSLRSRVWIYQFKLRLLFNRGISFGTAMFAVVFGAMVLFLATYFSLWMSGFVSGNVFVGATALLLFINLFSQPIGDIFLFFEPMGRYALAPMEKGLSVFFAIVLVSILMGLAYKGVWIIFSLALLNLLVFAFSIYLPQIKDWQQKINTEEEMNSVNT